MDLFSTIDWFIRELEADLESISWEIREETNYEDCSLDYLTDDYDEKEHHLNNLKEIRTLLMKIKSI